jgi:hypothetical protein
VKCRRVRGTRRWKSARRPCGVVVSMGAAEVIGDTSDFEVSFVSLVAQKIS